MKTKHTAKLVAMLLALILCLGACAQPTEAEQPAQPPSPSASLGVPEPGQTPAAAPEDSAADTPKTWEEAMQQHYDGIAQRQAAGAPIVKTLANGVQVQRTPADAELWNTTILHGDQRGCAACHDDLSALVDDYKFTDPGHYEHFPMRNNMGVEVTLMQCFTCHIDSPYYPPLVTTLHGLHNFNAAFQTMGGTCDSCHFVEPVTGETQMWDLVKYDVLDGITKLPNAQGSFRVDQDANSGITYNIDWLYANTYDVERVATYHAGIKPDPANDGIYEKWDIRVYGEVEQELVFNLKELIETAPKVTKMSKAHCTINPNGGSWISNVEITGIPISYLTNQAGVKNSATMFFGAMKNNTSYSYHDLSVTNLDECYLVYEINGEPIPYEWGYPLMSWYEGLGANVNLKGVSDLYFTSDDPSTFRYTLGRVNPAGEATNSPNAGFCNLYEGQIIPSGAPYTFEGYADAFQKDIVAVEFTFDNGATWTTFDTSETTKDRWVYWYFTWTPPAPGAYVVGVRALDDTGAYCYRVVSKLVNAQ